MFIVGAGLGMVMQVLVLAVQNAVDYRDMGVATSASQFFRSMGGTFGVAIYGTVLNNRLAANLKELLPRGAVPPSGTHNLTSSPGVIRSLPDAIQVPVIEAFVRSLDTVFLTAVPIVLVGFVLSFFVKELPLRGHGGPPEEAAAVQEAEDIEAFSD
jgi:hypothetical protein